MTRQPYAATCHGPLGGLDYGHAHPFETWSSRHLQTLIGGWLQRDPPCLELATLAHDELCRRRADLASGMKFAEADLQPIPWLSAARAVVRECLGCRGTTGRGRVYVILRDGYTEPNGWYGAYVGSTRKSVERRYREHRTGIRSARGLPVHGIEPLYSLFAGLNPVAGGKEKLRETETRLHEALAPVVPKVTGDVAF